MWRVAKRFIRSRKGKVYKEPKFFEKPLASPVSKEAVEIWVKGLSSSLHGTVCESFSNSIVESSLKKIFDLTYIDAKLNLPVPYSTVPKYKVYSSENLHDFQETVDSHMENLKNSIKVHDPRNPFISKILHQEPSIPFFSTSDFVFIDTSPSKNRDNRAVVIRRTNGDLEIANWEVRERLEIVFFGRPEQKYPYPSFTKPEVIKTLSSFQLIHVLCYITYYILPDSPLYQTSVGECFERLCTLGAYKMVASTHFFIPFLYHCLAYSNSRLYHLSSFLSSRSVKSVVSLANAFSIINPTSLTAELYRRKPTDNQLYMKFMEEVKLIHNNTLKKEEPLEKINEDEELEKVNEES